MSVRFYVILLLILSTFILTSCEKKKTTTNTVQITTSQALTQYWDTQAGLTETLAARDSTMSLIDQSISSLGS
jgi:hypothetical protein